MYKPNTKHHTWRKKLITYSIQASNKIWEIRNLLNFRKPTSLQSGEKKKLEPIILYYYTHYKRIIHHTHHHLFNTPYQLRITFSPQENKQWIKTVKIAIKLHKKKQKLFYAKHQKITRFTTITKRKSTYTTQRHSPELNTGKHKLRKTQKQKNNTLLFPLQRSSH